MYKRVHQNLMQSAGGACCTIAQQPRANVVEGITRAYGEALERGSKLNAQLLVRVLHHRPAAPR